MDVFALPDVLKLHQVSDEEWVRIQENPRFKVMLEQMMREWHSAGSTKERIRLKAATGLEAMLETLISGLADETIPYTQRVEGGKFLARIGEIDADQTKGGGATPFSISINIMPGQQVAVSAMPRPDRVIDAMPVIPEPEPE